MLQVIVTTPEQMKTLIAQILFRPDDETNGSMFPAELTVSEIQKFLQINDEVLHAWMVERGLVDTADDLESDLFEELDICDTETLRRMVIDEGRTPLLTHFQPGLLLWDIEDHFDRMGGDTSRLFQFTTLPELDFEVHMEWYKQLQVYHKESDDLRDRVNKMGNDCE